MPSIPSLLPKLKLDYPTLTITAGDRFVWSPEKKTVFYNADEPDDTALLLHELGHGLLDHHAYSKDVELLAMETAAWDKAKEIALAYTVTIDEDLVQDTLDSYREWLHARSTCPQCEATGYQSGTREYTCVACMHTWRVNEARLCALRRYSK